MASRRMLTACMIVSTVLACMGSALAAGDGWYMSGANPQRSSWVPDEVRGPLRPGWYRPIEGYIPQEVQAICTNGKVYISSARGLYALNAKTGELVWKMDTEVPLGNAPTVVDKVCYVGGMDRRLYALEADTGKQLWTFDGATAGYRTNPLVVDGKVMLGNRDGCFYAIGANGTPKQGQQLWKFPTDGPILNSAAYKDGVVYFASNDCRGYAVKADDGKLVWKTEVLPTHGFHSWWPVVYKDYVIFSGMPNHAGGPLTGETVHMEKADLFGAESGESGTPPMPPGGPGGGRGGRGGPGGQPPATQPASEQAGLMGSGNMGYEVLAAPGEGTPSGGPGGGRGGRGGQGQPGGGQGGAGGPGGRGGPGGMGGATVGPRGNAPGSWGEGAATLDMSKVIKHFGEKPDRRYFFVISQKDGKELMLDVDGVKGYAPMTVHGDFTHQHPPVLMPNGVLYKKCMFLKNPDPGGFVPRAATIGWEINPATGSRYVHLVGMDKAADEPDAMSGGGNMLYEVICCDREGMSYSIGGQGGRGGMGTFWSYGAQGMRNKFPDYDQMWVYFENRAMSGLWGFYGGRDGVYHNHGVQNPIIPYDGCAYSIKSNCVISFGTSAGAGAGGPATSQPARPQPPAGGGRGGPGAVGGTGTKLDLLKDANITQKLTPRTTDLLKIRLAEEVKKITDAGHLQPGYYFGGQFGVRYPYLMPYFQVPGDTFYVLCKALPHLSADQQKVLKDYLKTEFDKHPLMRVAAYGWQGAPRTASPYPAEFREYVARNQNDSQGLAEGWGISFPPQNIYGSWKYAEAGLGDPKELVQAAQSRLDSQPPNDAALLTNVWLLNMYVAGYQGYLNLQKLAGQQPDANVQAQLDRLMKLWAEKVDYHSPWIGESLQRGQGFHSQRMNIARCFYWMTPELGEYLHKNAKEKVAVAVDHLSDVGAYWFNAGFEGTMGEGNLQHLYDTHALFQARALALKQPREELDKWLDVPMFARGDLFYILNLVETIEAVPE